MGMSIRLIIILLLLLPTWAWGACSWVGNTGTVASPYDDADMQACVTDAATKTGAVTIQIPDTGGTVTWGTQVTIDMTDVSDPAPNWTNVTSLTIQGDSNTTTVIQDGLASSANAAILYIAVPEGKFVTVKDLKVISRTGVSYYGPIVIYGGSSVGDSNRFRITNIYCDASAITGYNGCITIGLFSDSSNTYGLIDNNTFYSSGGVGNMIRLQGGGAIPNAYSWTSVTSDFTENSNYVYIENNTFTFESEEGDGAYDSYNGARVVFRYNDVTGTHIGSHGNESSRSAHDYEIYYNKFDDQTYNQGSIGSRGGTGVIYGNTVTGSYFTSWVGLQLYRSCPWFEGTHTGDDNADTLTDANVTTNCAVGGFSTGGIADGYCAGGYDLGYTGNLFVYNQSDPDGTGLIASWAAINKATSTATTIVGTLADGTENKWDKGDRYTIWNNYNVGGMCNGYGEGDGNTESMEGWPCKDQQGRTTNQAIAPAYIWSNIYKGDSTPEAVVDTALCARAGRHVIKNREYFEQGDSFDGTSGVGVGTSKPATCTTAYNSVSGASVAYWDTSDNTLYKCTSENTWTAYHKAYSCPHPLTSLSGICATVAGKGGYNNTGGSTSGWGTGAANHKWTAGSTHKFQ